MTRSRSLVVSSVVFGFFAASLWAAETPSTPAKPVQKQPPTPHVVKLLPKDAQTVAAPRDPATQEVQLGEQTAAIEEALSRMIVMDFVDAPMQDVIEYLKDTLKIEIQLDRRVLEDVNITAETPVTVKVKGVTLKSALGIMLRNMQPELTYLIKNEVLLITTPEIAGEELITKLYPVGDLVACRDEHDALWDDYDSLIEVVTSTTKPTTWDTVGAPGSAIGNTFGTAKIMVVTQTAEVHEEIADLLSKIREIAKVNPNGGIPRRDRPAHAPKNTSLGLVNTGGLGGGVSPSQPTPKPAEAPKQAEPAKPVEPPKQAEPPKSTEPAKPVEKPAESAKPAEKPIEKPTNKLNTVADPFA